MALRLEPITHGNEAGETIVFIQGWPDDASLWDEAVDALAEGHRCVRVTLPNFDGRKTSRWGHSTDEIVDALVVLVRDAAKTAKGGRVTLVLHDWGCYWGHPVHHRVPELVSRVVGVDIAPHFKPSVGGAVGIVAYQSWLAWAFMIGGPVGDAMTRGFARRAKVPDARARPLGAWMNYPYRNVWLDLFSGRASKLTKGYWPTCPLLFIYGEKKLFAFHSQRWIAHLEKVGGKVVGLPVDHWVMKHPSFVPELVGWLEATKPQAR
ncbi:MAG: alpha/beta hydrolase [Labilithrix sp.]|nr:alpha/beta hydrolase [Labilithrix sp.]